MKRSLSIIMLTALFIGCQRPSTPENENEKSLNGLIDALPIEAKASTATTQPVIDTNLLNDIFIPIDPGHNIISVLNTNLDIDSTDEQLIALKKKDDPEDTIYLYAVDYDDVRNTYMLNWEGKTSAKSIRTFSMQTSDVTGNHIFEIIVSGTDHNGMQTLDIFQKTTADRGFGLNYTSIAQISADGTLDIQETERSDAYQFLQKTGKSFPVVALFADPESKTGRDLIQETYYWNHQKNQYVLISKVKIEGEEITEKELENLFRSNAEAFEQFLTGPWYKSDTSNTIIQFIPDQKQITFYSDNIQEIYEWRSSRKTIYKGIALACRNQSIAAINSTLYVTVSSMNEIYVSIKNFSIRNEVSTFWEGTYYRLSENLQQDVVAEQIKKVDINSVSLKGLFSNNNGKEFVFANPRFTERIRNSEQHGGYVIYDLDKPVLEFRYIDENGLTTDRKVFALTYTEETSEDEIKRTLFLTPAEIRFNAVQLLDTNPEEFIQREKIEKEKSKE